MKRGPTVAESVASGLNALRLSLRSALALRRGPPDLVEESKAALYDYLDPGEAREAERREVELRRTYGLEPLYRRSTRLDYRENVYLLDALDRLVPPAALLPATAGPLRAVDVGSKNFAYAFALERFLARRAGPHRDVELLGVELDGHVVYRDLRTRADHAEAYVRQTENRGVSFRVGDFCALDAGRFELATLFFPFVTRHALLRWGLPLRHFEPERLVAKAVEVTSPGGTLVILSQTEEERDRLLELLEPHRTALVATAAIPPRLVHYHAAASDRHGTVIRVP